MAAESLGVANKQIGVIFIKKGGPLVFFFFSLRHGWAHERGHTLLNANGSKKVFVRHCWNIFNEENVYCFRRDDAVEGKVGVATLLQSGTGFNMSLEKLRGGK